MELKVGKSYLATALAIKPYGVIMGMEDGSTQLLHISNIANTYVKNIHDYITEGGDYTVYGIEGKVRDVEISLVKEKIPYTPRHKKEESFESMLDRYLDPPYDKDRYYDRKNRRNSGKSKRRY